MKGWIKLHRKILDNGVFADAEMLKIFLWCLLKANRGENDKNVYGATIKQGQFLTGRVSASEELYIKPSTVHDRLKRLQRMSYIKLKSTNRYTIVTVLKFKQYQVGEETKPTSGLAVRLRDFQQEVDEVCVDCDESVVEAFISYWTETNKSATKMKFEMQQTWNTKRRLTNWNKNSSKFNKPTESKAQQQISNWQEARNIVNNG